MAARRELARDCRGRFISPPPTEPCPIRFPTLRRPRWRLRVFDQVWPWRAERAFAMDDALASGHADADEYTGKIYLIVPADLQQDPPPARPQRADDPGARPKLRIVPMRQVRIAGRRW